MPALAPPHVKMAVREIADKVTIDGLTEDRLADNDIEPSCCPLADEILMGILASETASATDCGSNMFILSLGTEVGPLYKPCKECCCCCSSVRGRTLPCPRNDGVLVDP